MTTTSHTRHRQAAPDQTPGSGPQKTFSALAGLTALAVLLQGLWAGMFLQYDNRPDSIVRIHDIGAWVAIALAVITFAWTLFKLRSRKDLLLGSLALTALLAVEGHLGGRITDNGDDVLTVVHVPLAMALMALCVWLPLRARRGHSQPSKN